MTGTGPLAESAVASLASHSSKKSPLPIDQLLERTIVLARDWLRYILAYEPNEPAQPSEPVSAEPEVNFRPPEAEEPKP